MIRPQIMTIAAVFRLRALRPNAERPYRVWGYPVVPVFYLAVAAFFLVYIPVANPTYAGLGLLLTAAGVPVYFYWRGSLPRPAR